MILHQMHNSIGNDIYSGFLYQGYNWVLHMHKSLEFTLCLKGSLIAVVGKQRYELTAGQFVFVMPYQPHSYITNEDTAYFVACFSKNHIPYFVSEYAGKEPDSSLLSLPEQVSLQLLTAHGIDPSALPPLTRHYMCKTPSMYERKAVLYAICAQISENCSWHKKSEGDDIVLKMLSYIDKHFTERISLSTMADELGYEYHYLSRVFHSTLNTSFSALVNQHRCEKAHLLLIETDDTVSDIAFACGFQSIRSFNRIFFDYCKQTPSQVKKGYLSSPERDIYPQNRVDFSEEILYNYNE